MRVRIPVTRRQRLALLRQDEPKTPDDLERDYDFRGEGEHPLFSRADWREMVANQSTVLGYWAWCREQVQAALYG